METKLVYYQKERPIKGCKKYDTWIEPCNCDSIKFWIHVYNEHEPGWNVVNGYENLNDVITMIKDCNEFETRFKYIQAVENQIDILNI